MSTDKKANASGRTGPIAHDLGKIRVGRLPTMNQDEYPGLSGWWVQLRIGEDGEEVLARVYGNTPEQAHSRATALAAQPRQALTQQTLDDVMAGIPARDAEIESLRKEIDTLRAQHDADTVDAERYRAWRDALITGKTAEDDFIRLVADSLPTSVGVSRRPTAAEWDAAIDAARKENSNA